MEDFRFTIVGFHSDNGSEYINRRVAKLLEKLRIEQTKSRSRHSNDNALAESKNASVVRKHMGYSHIPQRCASAVNAFCRQFLNPYVNFHRPCFFPDTITDRKCRTAFTTEDAEEHRGKQPQASRSLVQTWAESIHSGCLLRVLRGKWVVFCSSSVSSVVDAFWRVFGDLGVLSGERSGWTR